MISGERLSERLIAIGKTVSKRASIGNYSPLDDVVGINPNVLTPPGFSIGNGSF